LILPGVRGVRDWSFDEEIIELIKRNVRDPEMRMGDFRAQLGTNRIAHERFREQLETYGRSTFRQRIDALLEYTERRVRAAIEDLPDGEYHAEDDLDGDGIIDEPVTLALTVRVADDEMTIDFTGTADQNRGPLNCTPSLAFAGVMYPVIALLGRDFPKNDGFYRPFEIITPEGTMVNPSRNAPSPAEPRWRSGRATSS